MRVESVASLVPNAAGPVSVRLPRPLLDFVDQQAVSSFKSRNAYIRDLIAREYEAVKGGGK
jgi:Arc/MetJ-type ribon-helix-helix transcriptional regulator